MLLKFGPTLINTGAIATINLDTGAVHLLDGTRVNTGDKGKEALQFIASINGLGAPILDMIGVLGRKEQVLAQIDANRVQPQPPGPSLAPLTGAENAAVTAENTAAQALETQIRQMLAPLSPEQREAAVQMMREQGIPVPSNVIEFTKPQGEMQ